MKKIKELILEGITKLRQNNIEDSSTISKELLAYILGKDKQYIIINQNEELEKEQKESFNNYIEEIIQGKPIQYITHKQQFMHTNFYIDENVLVPQPDTEILVESVIEICKNINNHKNRNTTIGEKCNCTNNQHIVPSDESIKILDLCTGSGAIAISLELELKTIKTKIIASDISTQALDVARKNNIINNTNIVFVESDLFKNINQKDFDIIVSNPPYIKTDVIKELSKQVQSEPILALDGGKDGLKIYKKILDEAYKYIKNDGYLCLEIGYDQKEQVLKLVKKYSCYEKLAVVKDLAENDRCILIKIKKNIDF